MTASGRTLSEVTFQQPARSSLAAQVAAVEHKRLGAVLLADLALGIERRRGTVRRAVHAATAGAGGGGHSACRRRSPRCGAAGAHRSGRSTGARDATCA